MSDASTPTPLEDCSGKECPGSAAAIDWKLADPTYTASVRVTDDHGIPLAKARVKLENRSAETNENGFVQVGPLNARTAQRLVVTHEGHTPYFAQIESFEANARTAAVVLQGVGVRQSFATRERSSMAHAGATVAVPQNALLRPDGTRSERVRAEMTTLQRGAASMPRTHEARDRDGRPMGIGTLWSAAYVHFAAEDDGERLNLAPGRLADLTLPLPDEADVEEGDTLSLWSMNEEHGFWQEERACTVATQEIGGVRRQVCAGRVSHFSVYAVAKRVDILQPGALGCMNVTTVQAETDACYSVRVESLSIQSCNAKGEKCRDLGPDGHAALAYSRSANEFINYCRVLSSETATYRVVGSYYVDASGCEEQDEADGGDSDPAPVSGRRLVATEPAALESFVDQLGYDADKMLNFEAEGERDCPTLCTQVEVSITREVIESAIWADHDGDGAYATSDAKATPPARVPVDCDDGNALVRPNAPELFCSRVDMNCDGEVPSGVRPSDVTYGRWNGQCHTCMELHAQGGNVRAIEAADAEIAGNEFDDDCDGYVEDADGDGHNSRAFTWWRYSDGQPDLPDPPEPADDCDDWDDRRYPGATEIVGNRIDENCDHAAIDADGDGMPSLRDADLAEATGIDFDRFIDCDDGDFEVNPEIPDSHESGRAGTYYYVENGEVRRELEFCALFYADERRSKSDRYYEEFKDLNCDGEVYDLDGDGLGGADDCNDLDPRIGEPTMTEEAGLVCDVSAESLSNDSFCSTGVPYVPGRDCPALRINGGDLVTTCEEAKRADGTGTGGGVCSYTGWWEDNPLSITPGTLWGPCDGQRGDENNKLPDCPEGATCGGIVGGNEWTAEYEKYIKTAYGVEGDLDFRGTCFPGCLIIDCPAGEYVVEPSTDDTPAECAPCESGTFSAEDDASQCESWTECAPGERVLVAGTPSQDQFCRACEAGTYSVTSGALECLPVSDCEPGEYVDAEPTASSDRGCLPCPEGTFSNTLNAVECTSAATRSLSTLSLGLGHGCVVSTGGTLSCWGVELAGGEIVDAPSEPMLTVSNEAYISCGLTQADGHARCWGNDNYGVVTDVPNDVAFTEIAVTAGNACAIRATDGLSQCWGGDLGAPPTDVELTSLSAGASHFCALRADTREAVCWNMPDGRQGPTGVAFETVVSGIGFSCGLRSDDWTLECWGDFHTPTVPPSEPFVEVAAGGEHVCAKRQDGTLGCWGGDDQGQVSQTPRETLFDEFAPGYEATCAVLSGERTLVCWGGEELTHESNEHQPPAGPL